LLVMTWTSSNVSDIPVLAVRFALVPARIEARLLGRPETVLLRPEPDARPGAAAHVDGPDEKPG
jgi:hypothetical protein